MTSFGKKTAGEITSENILENTSYMIIKYY